ncbi:hypothetical protein BGY98DRAFT_987113 [Russula aff. rugulosa BPL654]|nr:hypothetical protein BGY98DRAFT_987113 [Russula aff. rugulosa BPL654]
MTNINKWFLTRLENIFPMKQSFRTLGHVAYEYTMASSCLAVCLGTNEFAVCRLSEEHGDFFTKQIDTAAASFHAYPNYLYCTYNADDFPDHEVTVVGAGAYGIGSAVGPFPERRHRGGIEGCDNLWPDDVSPSHHPSWLCYGNYMFSVVASPTNARSVDENDLYAEVRSLFRPFCSLAC